MATEGQPRPLLETGTFEQGLERRIGVCALNWVLGRSRAARLLLLPCALGSEVVSTQVPAVSAEGQGCIFKVINLS